MTLEKNATKRSRWLVPGLIFLLLVTMFARTPLDTDMWWHLRAGEATWTSASPLLIDIFSHTVHGMTWINHSWLAQVFFYLAYVATLLKGLAALVALVGASTMLILYAEMAGPPLFRAFIIILGALVIAPVLSPRPQIFSLLLLSILSFIVYENYTRGGRYYYFIPLIFILWSNLHGGYVIGLIFLGAWIVGELINVLLAFSLPSDERQTEISRASKHAGQIFIWAVIGGAATIINPNGIRIWLVPFQTVGLGVLQDLIPEWASPNFHNLFEQPFIWLLIACFIAVGLAKKRLNGPEIACFGIFTYMALISRRNFGPFAIIATPLLAKYTWDVISTYREPISRGKRSIVKLLHFDNHQARALPDWLRIGINILILFLLALIAGGKIFYVSSPAVVESAESLIFPVRAVQWIRSHSIPGEIFNDYNWGGYLIWNLREFPVFIDGRTDLYGNKILEDYLTILGGSDGWQPLLERYGVNSIIVASNSALSDKLHSTSGWAQAYQDELTVVYVRQHP